MVAAPVFLLLSLDPSVKSCVDESSSMMLVRLSADMSLSGTLPSCGMLSIGNRVVMFGPSMLAIRGTVFLFSSFRMESKFAWSRCIIEVFMTHCPLRY